MSLFDNLVIISFVLAVFLILFSNFLHKKLVSCLEDLQELKRFKEDTFEFIKSLEQKIYEYKIAVENITEGQENLNEHFKSIEQSFRELKETAKELQSAHHTKKALLDFMKG